MNIAVCDDQLEELKAVESLLRMWQEQQHAAVRLHLFHNAGELLEVLRRSESIYRQAAEHYNTALCKPWAYLPGRLLGFRKAPADIPIPPAA